MCMSLRLRNLSFLKINYSLSFSSASIHTNYKPESTSELRWKNFEDIPGPRGLLGVGSFYQYTSIFGRYKWEALHKAGLEKYKRWGPLVREKMLPGVDIVWLFDPKDIALILNDAPGNFPRRRSHLALEKYRTDRPHIYRTGGLLPTNGAEWWAIRSELQKGLSAPKNIRNLLTPTDDITKEFVNNIEKDKNSGNDFMPEISRLNLELLCILIFNERLNSFSESERLPESRSSRLMDSAEITNSCILPLDNGLPLWRFIETPVYKKLREAQEYMEQVAVDFVSDKTKFNRGNNSDRQSLVEEYLQNPKLKFEDIMGMLADLLLAGVHTSAYTTGFMLYHLATNIEAQNILHRETKQLLPDLNDKLTPAQLKNEAQYARAVLKETFRLNPISIGVGRILNKDTILSGYMVPKETVVVTQSQIACKLPENFVEPNNFKPERWLKSMAHDKITINPYLVLPFGHGMRSCIARRLAEQNILVLMIRLIRKFEITWCGAEGMDIKTKLINQPDQPIKIKFKLR